MDFRGTESGPLGLKWGTLLHSASRNLTLVSLSREWGSAIRE